MKKIVLAIMVFLMVFCTTACNNTQVDFEYYTGGIITIGVLSPSTELDYYEIVNNYSDTGNLIAPGIKEYTQNFFDEHTLVIIKNYSVSILAKCEVTKVEKSTGKIKLYIDFLYPYEITQGFTQCNYVFVELKTKEVKNLEIVDTVEYD